MAPAMIPPKAPDIMPALRKMMKRFDLRRMSSGSAEGGAYVLFMSPIPRRNKEKYSRL
jgi:hypothetical protein